MGRNDNLRAGLMTAFIIIIFLLTVYFCLDIFKIIDVPDSISLAKLLSQTTEEVVATKPIDEFVVTDENIDQWINNEPQDDEEPIDEENTVENEGEAPVRNLTSQQVVESEEPTTQQLVPASSSPTSRMYYYQLDMYGKMIYDRMFDNLENLKTGTYTVDFGTQFNDLLHQEGGDAVLENAFQLGVNSLIFDHPEIFYLDITKMYMSTEITSFGPLKTYRVKIGNIDGETYLAGSFMSKSAVDVVSEMVTTVKSNVLGPIRDADTYTKIKTVHDYLIDNVDYDQTLSQENIYNTFGALINKVAVCEGYAKAFKCMMDDLEIPCVIVCGIGQNSNGETESHAWNYVKIDDNWYAIDCTWDDPVIRGDGFVADSVFTRYFLKGSNDFFVDHTEDGKIVDDSSFVYPTLSIENYE